MNNPTLIYPVKNPRIIQEFGHDNTSDQTRSNFYNIFDKKHPGVDFELQEKSTIFSAIKGVVVRKEFHHGMGNVIGVRNGNIIALYAHLSKIDVKLGEVVDTGDIIGLSGNTGTATTNSPHLHFELRDITKNSLKKMVFKPIFGSPIKQWNEEFTYVIDNTNTKKTLTFLALRYFGVKNKWETIHKKNPELPKKPTILINSGKVVTIPNYYS